MATDTSTRRYQITSGPSREELFDSLGLDQKLFLKRKYRERNVVVMMSSTALDLMLPKLKSLKTLLKGAMRGK